MMPLRHVLMAALLTTAAGCGDPDPDTTFLARAAGFQLTVEDAARLLAPVEEMETPVRAAVTLANLWVDYTLLARATAEGDDFAHLDLEPVVEQQIELTMAAALSDSVERADAGISEDELDRRYEAEAEGSELRIRQILIQVPPDAPPARHDSARQTLRELRRRILETGEGFGDLARQYSQDPRSAPRGGDLGFVGPGDMAAPIDSAARALAVGEVSEPIQSGYGYHLILLEDRRTPTREDFAARLRRQRGATAAVEYLTALEERAAPSVRQDAPATVRQLASDPEAQLPEGVEDTLVTYRGGAVTVDDARRYLRQQPVAARQSLASAPAEDLVRAILQPLARREILGAEARRQGLEPSAGERQAALEALRQQLRETARQLGLASIPPLEEGGRDAIPQAVHDLLDGIVRNQRSITPLGPISQVLRNRYPYQIRDDRSLLVERRLEELKSAGGADSTAG